MSTVRPDLTVAEAILRRRSLEKQIEESLQTFSTATGLPVAKVCVERVDVARTADDPPEWIYNVDVKVALEL